MGSPHRVLIVEDDPLNRSVAEAFLEFLGFDIRAVCDGRQALDALGRETYDLVLMDCQMPVLDGLEATRRVRQRGILVPIIAFTALQSAISRSRCLAVGMNDVLPKPCELAEMEIILRRWLPAA